MSYPNSQDNDIPDFDDDDDSGDPIDPQLAESIKQELRKKVTEYVKRTQNLDDDEIATLFPDDKSLVDFANDVKRQAKHSEEDDDYLEDDADDDEDLPVEEIELASEDQDRAQELSVAEKTGKKRQKEHFERVQKQLPTDAQVSYEDMMAALEGLKDLDEPDGNENAEEDGEAN